MHTKLNKELLQGFLIMHEDLVSGKSVVFPSVTPESGPVNQVIIAHSRDMSNRSLRATLGHWDYWNIGAPCK